ncbi:MAG: prepilin-type N-terminal cleavage/methylation domain-containing protein [Deltaproteobacteria bacterium]|jgi:prepilin-type N-terminal cleavage/methylation domain-containing protein|nr:prepilin-type N-terminal cleavage/methylation domain-containing protein [Deltaproteobacteria bacterium]
MSAHDKTIRDGFTLVETLIALAVIMLGFMAALVMHTSAVRSAAISENQITAVFLAESKMEQLRVMTPSAAAIEEYFDRNGMEIDEANAFFTRSVTLKRQCPTQFTNELTVEVTWPKAMSLVYTSLIKAGS